MPPGNVLSCLKANWRTCFKFTASNYGKSLTRSSLRKARRKIYSSSLTDDLRPLVFDTSVLINLHACSYGERILAALPNVIIVPQLVAEELEHETSCINGELRFLHGQFTGGRVRLDKLTDEENVVYASLVSGSPSLGDGEAATIAIAARRQSLPLLDDRKARALATHAWCGDEPGWSLDLFRHSLVTSALGNTTAIHALYLALREGRMRIPVESTEYIVDLLGNQRARDCICLPNYRKLFGKPKSKLPNCKEEERQTAG